MLKEKKVSLRVENCIYWLILIFWRIPFLAKGIDYTDTGYSLAKYQQVFFGIGIDDIGTFLTDLIGGVVFAALPAYQLLVFRVMHWIMYVLVDIMTYQFFKKYLKPELILLVLLGLSLSVKSGEMLYSYYPLTKLLLIPAICLAIRGMEQDKQAKLFLAGIVCGINVFVRLPNVLFGSMIFAIISYGVWNHYEAKKTTRLALQYFLGCMVGFAVILIAMVSVMGIQSVAGSFMEYVNLALGNVPEIENVVGVEEISGHSMMAVFKTVARQSVFAARDFVLFLLPAVIVGIVIGKAAEIKKWKLQTAKVAAVLIETVLIAVLCQRIKGSFANIYVIAMLLMCGCAAIFARHEQPERRTLYLMVALLGLSCTLGSDLGLQRVGMLQGFVPLTLLMTIESVLKTADGEKRGLLQSMSCRVLREYGTILVIGMLVIGITYLPNTYMDAQFTALNEPVNGQIDVLKGMKTSANRAEQINEYYEISQSEDMKDRETAIFGYFPLGFVIGSQKNYFEKIQSCVDYPSTSVESMLGVINEKTAKGIYPVIVLSHVNKLQRGDDHDTSDAKMAVMEYMLSLHPYTTLVSSNNFEVYIPE